MFERLLIKWKLYKYRFVPWIALNLKNRSVQRTYQYSRETIAISRQTIVDTLLAYTSALHDACDLDPVGSHLKDSMNSRTQRLHAIGKKTLLELHGFYTEKSESTVCGNGVFIRGGRAEAGTLVSLYPGLLYEPGDPILLQSFGNQFIFRCADGLMIDGNDRGLSRLMYRSCAGREIIGPHLMCDVSWLGPCPINAFAMGQYVNNHNKDNPANVSYEEICLPDDVSPYLLKYIPNIYYSQHNKPRGRRLVALVTTRDISDGEELFSSYFTLTND